jgi:tetratricopeptide (TPR) repeat protein
MTSNAPPPETPPRPRKARSARPVGDQISGSIGDNVQGAIIGKNIFQNIIIIGKVKIPVIPVLVLIVLVVAAIVFFGVRLLGPDHMTGAFNLAVAEFGQLDASGRVSSSATGQLISQRLYEGLKIELGSLSPADRANFQPQVWQDSLDITQKRVTIGIIPGDTPQARWTAACALAKSINASVVIYGNLPPNSSGADFIPEFALCDNAGLRVDVDELVGAHQLIQGLPPQLIAQLGSPDAALAVNIKMNTWSGDLSLFCIGIMYDLQGLPGQALAVFQQARSQLQPSAGSGGEVLYFFIGREELTLASSATGAERDTHLANAQAAFNQSLTLDPTYARAHIGLGGVYFSRAQLQTAQTRLQSPDMANTFKEYNAALADAPISPGALLDVKARLSLASAWILQGDAQSNLNQFGSAGDSFTQAIQAASSALQPLIDAKQYRILAQAYLSLGEAYQEQGHLSLLQNDNQSSKTAFQKSSNSYQLCIQQKDADIADATLANTIVAKLCEPYKKDVDASLAELK